MQCWDALFYLLSIGRCQLTEIKWLDSCLMLRNSMIYLLYASDGPVLSFSELLVDDSRHFDFCILGPEEAAWSAPHWEGIHLWV